MKYASLKCKPGEFPPPPHPDFDPAHRNWAANDIILCIEAAKTLPVYQKLDDRDKV